MRLEDSLNYETLLWDVKDQVARVTLNRPEVLHALNSKVFNELESVFVALAGDVRVRVILLTGGREGVCGRGRHQRDRTDRCRDWGG